MLQAMQPRRRCWTQARGSVKGQSSGAIHAARLRGVDTPGLNSVVPPKGMVSHTQHSHSAKSAVLALWLAPREASKLEGFLRYLKIVHKHSMLAHHEMEWTMCWPNDDEVHGRGCLTSTCMACRQVSRQGKWTPGVRDSKHAYLAARTQAHQRLEVLGSALHASASLRTRACKAQTAACLGHPLCAWSVTCLRGQGTGPRRAHSQLHRRASGFSRLRKMACTYQGFNAAVFPLPYAPQTPYLACAWSGPRAVALP